MTTKTFATTTAGALDDDRPAPPLRTIAAPAGFARDFGFRFLFAYWLLTNLPQPLGIVPFFEPLTAAYDRLWRALVPWVGRHLLGLSRDVAPSPSGTSDAAYDYVWLFCALALSAAIGLAWSLFERREGRDVRRREARDARLYDGLVTYLRYVLGSTMLLYGMLKVFKVQFPTPAVEQLSRTYGDSSPQSLLWAFMGYSTAYSAFAGGAEALGGLLLFFRRTTSLGALMVAAVMANVVALNFCYCVGVKVYSSHLLSIAIFLLAADARRLVNVLVLGRPAEAAPPRAPLRSRRLERARPALKALFIAGSLACATLAPFMIKRHRDAGPPDAPTAGPYTIEAPAPGGEGPRGPADVARWRTVILGRHNSLVVQRDDGSMVRWLFRADPAERTLTLKAGLRDALPGGAEKVVLRYQRPDPAHLTIEGVFDGEPLALQLTRAPEPTFPLNEYRFHWVQETTYND